MKISVIGVGHIGAVLCGCLAESGHEVVAVDIDERKVECIDRGVSPVLEPGLGDLISAARANRMLSATTNLRSAVAAAEMSFVCVGTSSNGAGSPTAHVEAAIREIAHALRGAEGDHAVVMRSTVPPGTAERLCIPLLESISGRRNGADLAYISNPEFLREGCAIADFRAPAMILAGVREDADGLPLRAAYAGIDAPLRLASYRTAESVKFLSNAFHALKVAFANEAGAVLSALDIDAEEAFSLFRADDVLNISKAYLRPGFAFGGGCLPKDLRIFVELAEAAGVETPLLANVARSNEATIERAFQAIMRRAPRRIAFLGLTFKPGTNDLRESPYVDLARRLRSAGPPLRIFDAGLMAFGASGEDHRAAIERAAPDLAPAAAASAEDAVRDSDLVVVAYRGAIERDVLNSLLGGRPMIDLELIA